MTSKWALASIGLYIASSPLQAQTTVWGPDSGTNGEVAFSQYTSAAESASEDARVLLRTAFDQIVLGEPITAWIPGLGELPGTIVRRVPTVNGGVFLEIGFDEAGVSALIHNGLNSDYGRIWTPDGAYVIETRHNQTTLSPAPLELFEEDGLAPPVAGLPTLEAHGDIDGANSGTDTLDFLYFYDQDMISVHGWGLTDLAHTDVNNLTTALENSDVPLVADITQFAFMDIEQSYSSSDLLYDAGGRTGIFSELSSRVDALDIDIVSLNRIYDSQRDGFCGLGFVPDPTVETTYRAHINVCHNGVTLAHETGHNLGLTHGEQTDGAGSGGRPVPWARGFRIDSANSNGGVFTSIMAYGSNRSRYLFSDPTKSCPERGSVCGEALDPNDPNVGAYSAEALRRWATGVPSDGVPNPRLLSSVLPTSRFVMTGEAATAFMTIINPGSVDGTNCLIEHHGPYRQSFTYQSTDPATNVPVGEVNTPVDIPAGEFRTFIVSITPGDEFSGARFAPYASCSNIPMAAVSRGLNTIDLGASNTTGPDLIALSRTIENNGIVDIPAGNFGVFSVATINIGAAGNVVVRAASLSPDLPASALVCQTNAQGACMGGGPTETVSLSVAENGTPTFGVFVQTEYVTPFNPANRFQFQMEVNGEIRGSTSVALRDQGSMVPPIGTASSFSVTAFNEASGNLASLFNGFFDRFEIVSPPLRGSLVLEDASTGRYTYTAPSTGGGDSFTYRAGNASGWSAVYTASISVDALSLPILQGFTTVDDTDGPFRIDLDDFADPTIEIDRYVLTQAPSGDYEFDALSGVLTSTLPSSIGVYSFQYAAENRAGESAVQTATVNVEAYNICAPARLTRQRIERRLIEMTVTDGATSFDEAEQLGIDLCMTETSRDSSWIYFNNAQLGTTIVFGPRSNSYTVYYRSQGDSGWTGNFSICKEAGTTTLSLC